MLFATSCSKDSNETVDNPGNNENSNSLETISNDIHAFLVSHEGATIEDIQEQLNKYSTSVTSEVVDDVLYVYMDDDIYICDPYKRTCFEESDKEIEEVDIESMLNEINNALYHDEDEDTPNATPTIGGDIQDLSRAESVSRSTGNEIVLTKKRVLYWDPDNSNTRLGELRIDNKNIAETKQTLNDLKSFSDYDVVVMFCHGSTEGLVGLPTSFKNSLKEGEYHKGSIGTGEEADSCIYLTKQKLESLMPDDMSHTMVFMCMCYSDSESSVIHTVLNSKHVLAFGGASSIMDNAVVDFIIKDPKSEWGFLPSFYNQEGSADEIIKKIFGSSSNSSPISRSYVTMSGHSGNYHFYYNNKIYYEPLVTAMSEVNNQPRASVKLPYELAIRTVNAVKTRAASSSEISAGFWLKNKSTGEETELEIQNSSVTLYKRYNYKQLISRIELLGNTDNISFGTYEYRTYLDIDGEKQYSDKVYEFTKKGGLCPDENHPHAIDLGLPSGTKWACCNVGAKKPEEDGGYYAWGETSEKSNYDWNTYTYYNSITREIYDIGSDIAGTSYNVAHVKWGEGWRMPSYEQLSEMCDNCTSEWITYNGTKGRIFTSKISGEGIFMPAAHHTTTGNGSGSYWSSSVFSDIGQVAILSFTNYYNYRLMDSPRCKGYSVRPVLN